MQVKILGSAAGGGFPQWNCACPNCHAVRRGQFRGKARSQTQVAVSDDKSWFLLGELQPFQVWAAESVIHILRGENSMFGMLNRVADQVHWSTIRAGVRFTLKSVIGNDSGIGCMPIAVSSSYPAYANRVPQSDEAVVGLILTAPSGATLGFFPQLSDINPILLSIFAKLDC